MTPANSNNCYLPHPAIITDIITENSQIKTFVIKLSDQALNDSFTYAPGQFLMVSVPHAGEAPISISSSPTRAGVIHLSVRMAGTLTKALHDRRLNDIIAVRGPYGRPFPLVELEGYNLVFVAGGIGLAPLRSVINYCLDMGAVYGNKTILYGSRHPSDIAFRQDLDAWAQTEGVNCLLTVDQPDPSWVGRVGVVTTLWNDAHIDPTNTKALICGPPAMIKFVLGDLFRLGFRAQDVLTTMERQMKCGIGICGHCHMEGKLVCKHGPVFTAEALRQINAF